jgi:hypothetical protein
LHKIGVVWWGAGPFGFLSCPNVQTLRFQDEESELIPDEAFLKSLLNCSGLQELSISILHGSELYSLFRLGFCGALQQGAWQEIRKVEMRTISNVSYSPGDQFFNQIVEQKYEKWWNRFKVSKIDRDITLEAYK